MDISYSYILIIADAFQIVSGQRYALDKTKILLNMLATKSLNIEGYPNKPICEIFTPTDLSNLFKEIDSNIKLEREFELEHYFSH